MPRGVIQRVPKIVQQEGLFLCENCQLLPRGQLTHRSLGLGCISKYRLWYGPSPIRPCQKVKIVIQRASPALRSQLGSFNRLYLPLMPCQRTCFATLLVGADSRDIRDVPLNATRTESSNSERILAPSSRHRSQSILTESILRLRMGQHSCFPAS